MTIQIYIKAINVSPRILWGLHMHHLKIVPRPLAPYLSTRPHSAV